MMFNRFVTLLAVMLVGAALVGLPLAAHETAAASHDAAKKDMDDNSAASQRGGVSTEALVGSLTVFLLAIFLGYEVITKVPPTLHTPLMSGSNAISGITLVGALLVTATGIGTGSWLGMAAVMLATVNVVGGFLVTHRMLSMFKKK